MTVGEMKKFLDKLPDDSVIETNTGDEDWTELEASEVRVSLTAEDVLNEE